MICIALLGQSDVDIRRYSSPILKAYASSFNETVFLARLRDSKVEIIHVETPEDPSRAYIHPGIGDRPLHACSCSKAIAAFAEPDLREAIMSSTLKKCTEYTKTSRADLTAEFFEIKKRGFAFCDQEIDIGIASIAAPVWVGSIGAPFGVGAVGPVRRFGTAYRLNLGNELKQLASKVSGAVQMYSVG